MSSTNRCTLLFVALLLVAVPDPSGAQQSGRLFLAVPQVFPDVDARAIVVRERDREVVLLRPDEATAEALAAALATLRRVRQQPLAADRGQMIPITGFAVRRPLAAARRARLEEALGELARRPLSEVGPFGPGRWMRFEAR